MYSPISSHFGPDSSCRRVNTKQTRWDYSFRDIELPKPHPYFQNGSHHMAFEVLFGRDCSEERNLLCIYARVPVPFIAPPTMCKTEYGSFQLFIIVTCFQFKERNKCSHASATFDTAPCIRNSWIPLSHRLQWSSVDIRAHGSANKKEN